MRFYVAVPLSPRKAIYRRGRYAESDALSGFHDLSITKYFTTIHKLCQAKINRLVKRQNYQKQLYKNYKKLKIGKM